MPIQTNNLVLYKSERLTDTIDGGGKYSGQVIVDGQSNNLFNDVSEMDRTMGRVSMRKIYPAITTNDTDSLMGATVFLSENPADPNVSALLFSTESWTDERLAAQNRVENYLAKGGQIAGTPLDTLYQGMRIIQVAMFKQEVEANVGDTIALVSNEGLSNQKEQYVRITRVETRTAILTVNNNQPVEYKIATYDINDPLAYDFIGLSAVQWYGGNKSQTIIRETLVADTGKYYASVAVTENATVGTYTVQAASMFSQLVPSAQIETPLLDLNAASESVALVSGNTGTITASYTTTVGTTQNLYMGSSVMPSSVSFTLFGNAIIDQGGLLKNSAGVQIGTIDYQRGLIQWTASAGTGSTTLNISFKPAAAPTQPFQSYAVPVTKNNQSTNWTGVLVPTPAPGSLSISYMSQGKFYTLKDSGNGQLKGSNDAYGTGTINYVTGSWLLTTGALPDVDTPILLLWGSPFATFERANSVVSPAAVEFDLLQKGITASSVTVTWMINGVNKTATSNAQGQFIGDATGTINYAAGTGRIVPNKLPQKGTVFTINYSYGTPLDQSVTNVTPSNGQLSFNIGTGAAIQPNSVELSMPVSNVEFSLVGFVTVNDIPVNGTTGNLVDRAGNVQGTITYSTGAVVVTPLIYQSVTSKEYINVPYSMSRMGTINSIELANASRIVRSSQALKANTNTTVTVKYRDTSGSTSGSKQVTLDSLKFDLTRDFNEQILTGSVRFSLGSDVFIDRTSTLYRAVDPATGSGTASGTVQYGTGLVELTSWTPNVDNVLTLQSLTTTTDLPPVNHISFRTPTIPVRPGSLTVVVSFLNGGQATLTSNAQGVIETSKAHGQINHDTGFVDILFYTKTEITTANRATIEAHDWYNVALEYAESGKTYINVPEWIAADSIRYNAIAYTYIPLDSDILGLSATRLPLDGRVPVFRIGDIGIISATKLQVLPSNVAGQTYNLNDQRISWCELQDANGIKVPYAMYVVDYDYGKVTLSGDFALNALVAPISAKYRYQDMGLINDVQINGQITFTKPLTHNYTAANSIVGSALVIGDMQARYTKKFAQTAWSSVWADTPSGAAISANYNDALYPIAVTNNGAIQERWALVFTDATNFKIIGEYSGQIGTGSVIVDCAPLNPVTNAPYFTVKKEGWGSGWVSGNVLRFNTIAANFPVWCIRTVKQSEPTVMSDQFQIMFRGDIDREI